MELNTIENFNGPIATLSKIINDCNKNGIKFSNVINVLRRPDKKEVLKEIMELGNRTRTEVEIEKYNARIQRASDFGIGEN